jgi:glutamyl/glutaminyl-tRNA synthetase
MEISHVTRGYEWLPSFPRNILLYQAFGWTAPKFIHLPLILNKEGGKLSKRQGAVFVEEYRAKGYLPEALINFCVLMGWHPKGNQEIFSLEELKKVFSISGLGTSPAVFDTDKLDYFNGYYLRQKPLSELSDLCRPYLTQAGRQINDSEQLKKFVGLARDRMKKLSDVVELTDFLFALPPYEPGLLIWKTLDLETVKNNLRAISGELEKIKEVDWNQEYLEKAIIGWLKDNNKKNGDYLWPLRVALTGLKNSPGPFETAGALGREESFKRLGKAGR